MQRKCRGHTGHIYNHPTFVFEHSPAHLKLRAILANPKFLSDLRHQSSTTQTSSLESFNNMLIRFAPKSIAYS
ncbi:hypothetical protein HPB48_015366 [Haemaphysalis longicornis]|uniref:Uncharacterized protein n=1 Tax=Haemaphysalis longicornis TaxID=44386 RepID=A0A9J6GLY7_HAELO|nr:hypothetical protein HPB48_015366 [Haemaphysalis longicornis]